MRTFIYIIASVIVALSLLIFNEASPQGFPNKSLLEPVVINIGQIEQLQNIPLDQIKTFSLEQNFPNPFNPQTIIRYSLKKEAQVSLEVYNLLGERVVVLVNGKTEAGWHEVIWGAAFYPAGVYFLAMKAGDFSKTRKMILIK